MIDMVDFSNVDAHIQRMKDAPNQRVAAQHAILAYNEVKQVSSDPNLAPDEKAGLKERLRTILADGFGVDPDAPPPEPVTTEKQVRRGLITVVGAARKCGLTDDEIKTIMEGVLDGTPDG